MRVILLSVRILTVHDSRFVLMDFQFARKHPILEFSQESFSLFLCPAVNYSVSRPGEFHPQSLSEPDLNL